MAISLSNVQVCQNKIKVILAQETIKVSNKYVNVWNVHIIDVSTKWKHLCVISCDVS